MSKGVLLVNLGSPDSTAEKDVKSYLDEFLMDEYVIDMPYWKRVLLVRGMILRTRPKKSAQAYKKIWWDEGSPLIVLTRRLQKKVQQYTQLPVEIAMRYKNPSIEKGIQELVNKGVSEILLIPLYPQYAMSTTKTILVLAEKIRKEKFPQVKITEYPAFYHQTDYVEELSASIKEKFKEDYLLFSYHGVPERHIYKTDPTNTCKIDDVTCTHSQNSEHNAYCYRHQCLKTTELVAQKLGLKQGTYGTSFQSRLGNDPWIQPYTDATIEALAHRGVKRLAVVTPAFVSDCLETLEEIGMEGKEEFLENGGEHFNFIPCLNDRESWAAVIGSWINNWNKYGL